jgi:ectoine hydroxylase-related dioxygenase (phytanoyl-CoA dioxygenase family)
LLQIRVLFLRCLFLGVSETYKNAPDFPLFSVRRIGYTNTISPRRWQPLLSPRLTQEQIEQFRRDGFLNFGSVLTPEETQTLHQALTHTLHGESSVKPESTRNISGGGDVVTQVVNIWEAEPAFHQHLYNERIVPLVAQLMGTDTVRVWHDQIQVKPPLVGGPTIWHQDHPYWPVIAPADLVSAWVALEDATEENGCMSMVPGSHRWGPYNGGTVGSNRDTWGPDYNPAFIPEGETVRVVPCPVKAGSVVFHHCLTWHGAPPNRSQSNRPAIAVHYMPGHVRYQPEAGKTHLIEHHITVKPGEVLTGDHFPTVMEHGKVLVP